MWPRRSGALLVLAVALASVCALGVERAGGGAPGPSWTLVAVGDVATCGSSADERTEALAASIPGQVALLGDIVYPSGSARDYAACFDPSWGPLTRRIAPALGNHDYNTGTAAVAIRRFGIPRSGWYAYTLGTWRIVVLNSNCAKVGGCGRRSPQWRWLRAELTTHAGRCTLAYWHHPRLSSGLHGANAFVQPLWDLLADAGAELVLSGHDHDYERFAPTQGIRQFVVGTGGAQLYPILFPRRGSVVRSSSAYGVLRLTLFSSRYAWQFVPAAGSTFTDAGSARCH